MKTHIEEYIRQTTLEHFPYIRKLNTAYLKAMLSDSEYFHAVQQLNDDFNPDKQWFLMGELYPGIRQFTSKAVQSALSFGIQRKTLYAMQLMVKTLNLGDVSAAYGNAYGRSAPIETDEYDGNPMDHTDEGSYTDSVALPLYVMWLDYAVDNSIGVATYDEAVANSYLYGPLLIAVKPARIPILALGRKNCFISSRKQVGCAQASGPSFSQLENLPESTLKTLYHNISVASSIFWSEIYSSNTKRVFEIRSEVILHTITILSGTTRPSIVLNILDDPVWDLSSMNMFRYRICLNFSKNVSTDNLNELKYE